MCFFISFIPATFWVVVGFFVLFSATKSDSGGIAAFGKVLSVWLFLIATAIVIGAGYITLAGFCRFGDLFAMMHAAKP